MPITKDNIRDFAIQRVESYSIRKQVVLALRSLGEKTIPVDDTVFTETRTVENDYFRWNGRSWETHGDYPNKTILKPSEFLKAVAHLLLSTNPRDYVIQTTGSSKDRLKVLEILTAHGETLRVGVEKYPTAADLGNDTGLFYYNGAWSHIATTPSRTVITPESFLKMYNAGKFQFESTTSVATPSTLDTFVRSNSEYPLLVYIHKNKLAEDLLRARPTKFPDRQEVNLDIHLNWTGTPQGHSFWKEHHNKCMTRMPGKVLNEYLDLYNQSVGIKTEEVKPVPSETLPAVVEGQVYYYNKTKTRYRVRKASVTANLYTLASLTTDRTASWCQDITLKKVHELFTLIPATSSHSFKEGDMVRLKSDLIIDKYYGRPGTQIILLVPMKFNGAKKVTEVTKNYCSIGDYVYAPEMLELDGCKGVTSRAPEEVSSPVLNSTAGMDPLTLTPVYGDHFTKTYKVGDKLMVRPDLIAYEHYSNISPKKGSGTYVNKAMTKLAGQVVTIEKISEDYFKLKESSYDWTRGMLIPLIEEQSATQTSVLDATAVAVGTTTKQTSIKTKEDKPMPKTLKDNAVELVQENKAAAFTAAEIKAGQIINKQAISLIKPKLPMMVRGYADSPVASVVLANVVALGLKHYAAGNKKLEKISELMIAGAAFDSIDALNIDGIVNDFIAGLKLPAGVEIE